MKQTNIFPLWRLASNGMWSVTPLTLTFPVVLKDSRWRMKRNMTARHISIHIESMTNRAQTRMKGCSVRKTVEYTSTREAGTSCFMTSHSKRAIHSYMSMVSSASQWIARYWNKDGWKMAHRLKCLIPLPLKVHGLSSIENYAHGPLATTTVLVVIMKPQHG